METDDLDWKTKLPPRKNLAQNDFPKDVAAMANAGGGVIIYGVEEVQKAATRRTDAGELGEIHERALRSAAYTAISPPVMGLKIYRLGDEGHRAVIVEIPASTEGPHLIYRQDLFGAPKRNDADTVWMREREIEVAYRARFEERRRGDEALAGLYDEAAAGRGDDRAWLIAVARPRFPHIGAPIARHAIGDLFNRISTAAPTWSTNQVTHPISKCDFFAPRPGLRRWVAPDRGTRDNRETWASVHHDGSATLVTTAGGHSRREGNFEPHQIESSAIELGVVDFLALAWSTAEKYGLDEYDVRMGLVWSGKEPLRVWTVDSVGDLTDQYSTPLWRYTPVDATLNLQTTLEDFQSDVYEFAVTCVNQTGLRGLRWTRSPDKSFD
ncbi:ATP-binding protein [Nesterenkonia natronophila]|uniref:ATP-binding protein n=2 Tax=Nesterenkonia natronophila TaxID=2174932 RepID=A0A3A4F367_9MICC|nr:ATP-binding protein [Nesterenkonia natronophila]